MKVKSESEVTQSCPTLRDPMDCSLLGSSIHGILQARVLEWNIRKHKGVHSLATTEPKSRSDHGRILLEDFVEMVGCELWEGKKKR